MKFFSLSKFLTSTLIKSVFVILVVSIFSACGGGGGSSNNTGSSVSTKSSSSSSTSKASAPGISILNPTQKIRIGEAGKIDYTSTNANSCSEEALGTLPIAGSFDVKPIKGGQVTYTITCTGDGGSVSRNALVMTPYPILSSSYKNAKAEYFPLIDIDKYFNAWNSPVRLDKTLDQYELFLHDLAVADFLQNGTATIIASSTYLFSDEIVNAPGFIPKEGRVFFFVYENDAWVSKSHLISGNAGCIHPRKPVIADFNNDGFPDVLFACHGFDRYVEHLPVEYLTESQLLVLSDGHGNFNVSKMPNTEGTYGHGATADDIDGDGNIDIIIADFKNEKSPIRFFIGHGDGTFTEGANRLPLAPLYNGTTYNMNAYFTVESIDIGGKKALLIGGTESIKKEFDLHGATPTAIYFNNSGMYTDIPIVIPSIERVNNKANIVLDFLLDKDNLYIMRAMAEYSMPSSIQRLNLSTMETEFCQDSAYLTWIFLRDGKIRGDNAAISCDF